MQESGPDRTFDHFNVILTGKVNAGVSRHSAAQKLAKTLDVDKVTATKLLQGSATVLKRDVSHKTAFALQKSLEASGAEVLIKMLPVHEQDPEYSMVPAGEEQTPYAELQNRLKSGESIECSYCHKVQSNAPYCAECGRQLIGTTVKMEVPKPQQSSNKGALFAVILVLAIAVATGIAYWFNLI